MPETPTLPTERFSAKLRFGRISPQKLRYVADTIRGHNVNRALEILQATPRRGARFLYKLLKSAIANAESITSDRNLDIDVEELRVEALMVDGGPSLKRWRTAPQGRAVPILKRTSHATMVLGPKPEEKKQKRAPAAKKEKAGKGEAAAEKGHAHGGEHHDHAHGPEGHVHGKGHDHPEAHHQHHEHPHRHESEHKHGGQHEKGRNPASGDKKG